MESSLKSITIDGKEYELPEGVQSITDDGLFWIDFSLITVAEEYDGGEDKDIKFFNPRHLGSYTIEIDGKKETFHGQGFDKESMRELLEDIQNKGLNYPLLACWAIKDNKIVGVRVNDGERRFRCVDRMVDKNEKAWSQAHGQFMPAKEVYSKIICRVKVLNDEESLQEACEVSGTAVPWGAAAQARLIKVLYDKGKGDVEVCKLLRKKPQWVAETYSLNELDELTFNYLLSGKINRSTALRLLKEHPDVKERQSMLTAAWKEAVKRNEQVKEKLEAAVEKAEADVELAESEVVEAELMGADQDEVEAIKEEVEEKQEKVKNRQEALAASAKPIIKNKDVDRASTKGGKKPRRCLRPPKIQKQLDTINEMIEKDDETVCTLDTLRVVSKCYKGILDGEMDVVKILKKI